MHFRSLLQDYRLHSKYTRSKPMSLSPNKRLMHQTMQGVLRLHSVRPLFRDRLIGIARRGQPFLQGSRDIDTFCAAGHVIIEPGAATWYNAQVDEQLQIEGRSRRVLLSKPTFLGVPFIVEQTDLLAILPEQAARGFARFTDIELFEPPIELKPFDVVLLWHERTHTSPAHRWFRDLIIELCAGKDADLPTS